MAYSPISSVPIQYSKADGTPANGYYIKFYLENSNTPISMQTDASGATSIAKAKLNESGYPISNPNDENTVFIPHLSTTYTAYRFVLYASAADADANNVTSGLPNIQSVEINAATSATDDLRADLAANSGSSLVGFLQNGTGSVARTIQEKNKDIISVKDFGAVGNGIADDTASIIAAIASFPDQGSPLWKPWVLHFPPGRYKVTSTINVKNQQGSAIFGYGAALVGDFDGTVLQIGDLTGSNDVLWVTVSGLTVEQNNSGISSRAVALEHAYSCTVENCFFYGGRYALVMDGNANLISRTTFRGAITSNVITATTANNEVNLFCECAFENGAGYGIDLQVNSGVGGGTEILNCYFESNSTANVRAKNTSMFRVAGCYFNLQNNAIGVLLDGSVGASYPSGYGLVENNRILGHASLTPYFIKENSSLSINCSYKNNKVESDNCELYGGAEKSVNLERLKDFAYVSNSDIFSGGSPPTGWTVVNGPVSTGTSVSNYGSGASLVVPTNGYAYQQILAPSNALLRISVWANCTASGVASLQIWSNGLGSQLKQSSSSSTVNRRIEIYLTPSERLNSTTFVIMLRNTGVSDVRFSDIKIEDMTN